MQCRNQSLLDFRYCSRFILLLLRKMAAKVSEPTMTPKRTKFQKNATTNAKKKFLIVGTLVHQRKVRRKTLPQAKFHEPSLIFDIHQFLLTFLNKNMRRYATNPIITSHIISINSTNMQWPKLHQSSDSILTHQALVTRVTSVKSV